MRIKEFKERLDILNSHFVELQNAVYQKNDYGVDYLLNRLGNDIFLLKVEVNKNVDSK